MGIPVHRNYNKYVWIGIVRMEMASDLKTSGRIFQVTALLSQIKSLKTNFGLFLFWKFHLLLPPWWYKSNSCVSKVLGYKLIKIVTKKLGKSPWECPFKIAQPQSCSKIERFFFSGQGWIWSKSTESRVTREKKHIRSSLWRYPHNDVFRRNHCQPF